MKPEDIQRKTDAAIYVKRFIAVFHKKFGVVPSVMYSLDEEENIPLISLNDLEKTVDSLISKDVLLKDIVNISVKSRSRKKRVMIFRQCTFKVATLMGYTYTAIGRHFEYDHSSIIYSCNTITGLLESGYSDILTIYTLIKDEIKEKFGDDGSLQSNTEGEVKS